MAKLQLDTTTVALAINTPVRIIASGGMGADYFGLIALTGATTSRGGGWQTVIKVIDPDTGALVQKPWRTDFLEALGEEEGIEQLEKLKCAIAHSRSVASSVVSQACAAEVLPQQDLQTNSQLPSLSNQTPTVAPSLDEITPIPTVTTTSELLVLNQENSTSLLVEVHAPICQLLEIEKGLVALALVCGLKCCGLSQLPNQILWFGKTWQAALITVYEQSWEDSDWQATLQTLKQSRRRSLAHPTKESESLLLPTPTALSKPGEAIYRNPGRDKLEQRLSLLPTPTTWGMGGRVKSNGKQGRNLETELRLLPTPTATDTKGKRHSKTRQGGKDLETELQPLIPKGHVSTPELREWMMGMPAGSTDITAVDGGKAIPHQNELAHQPEVFPTVMPELPPLEILAPPNKPRSPGEESLTSIASVRDELSESRDDNKVNESRNSEEINVQLRLPGVQQEVSKQRTTICEELTEVLQSELLCSGQESTQGRTGRDCSVRIGDDTERDSSSVRVDNIERKSSLSEGRLQDHSSSSENCSGAEWELEGGEDSNGFRIHHGSVSGTSKSNFIGGELCSATHFDNGEVFGSISKVSRKESSRKRSSSPHQLRQAGQPNRESSIDESKGTRPASRTKQKNGKETQENGYGGNIHIHSSSESLTGNEQWSSSGSAQPPATLRRGEVGVCGLDELTDDEVRELHRLELLIERAFYQSGVALRSIRDKRLYRGKYKTFEQYCKERFGFQRRHSYQLIEAAGVVDNLCANGAQESDSDDLCANGSQILPTTERQVRSLVSLEPEEQRQIWQEAVEKANGKIPSGAAVKSIVQRIKERTFVPLTDNPQYQVSDVVRIKGGATLRPYDGYWGVIERVSDHFYHVSISLKKELIGCKGYEVERLDIEEKYQAELREVSDRIKALVQLDLDPAVWSILETLSRQTCLTQMQLDLLDWVEKRYGIE